MHTYICYSKSVIEFIHVQPPSPLSYLDTYLSITSWLAASEQEIATYQPTYLSHLPAFTYLGSIFATCHAHIRNASVGLACPVLTQYTPKNPPESIMPWKRLEAKLDI